MLLRRVLPLLAALAALVAGCSGGTAPPAPGPHPARQRAVDGRITAENGESWTVTTTSGPTWTVQLSPATHFGSAHQASSAAQFPVGAPVRVLGAENGTTITARRVLPPLSGLPGRSAASPASSAPPSTTAAPPVSAPVSPAAADQRAATAVDAAVAKAPVGVAVGVAVMDAHDGAVIGGSTGSTGFESASVVKLFTVVDLLHRSETGDITLSAQDQTDIGNALSHSDDGAMDDLWEGYGGAQTISDVVSLADLQDTEPPSDPGEWGEATISARDVLAVYRYAFTQLSPADQQVIRTGLVNASDSGADGFDQAFGLLDPPRVAGAMAKQGWMSDGDLFLHTTGVPAANSPWIVAVLTKQPGGNSWDTARSAVDSVSGTLTAGLPTSVG